jgi:integrase
MSGRHSTTRSPSDKPAKPDPEFPLFPHASGQWAKKIRGKLHYFGKWDDPDAALDSYLREKDDLHAGRKPRPDAAAVTIKQAVNDFLNAKLALVQSGELSPRTMTDYREACLEMARAFGKQRLVVDLGPDDFAALRKRMTNKWGPRRVGKMIQCVRCAFKHALDSRLITTAVHFGPEFKQPSKKVLRLLRTKKGANTFTAEEIRRLIDAADMPLRAMILLGINCGLGNSDCARLPITAVDLDQAMIDYPRPKTGILRRCPLWPETVAALRDALAKRPKSKRDEDAALVFLTKYGGPWKNVKDSTISRETKKLLHWLGIKDRRNFYTLRHTFRTVADEWKDQPAADLIMGHESPHMSTIYRETISDDRLRGVAAHVRKWLFEEQSASADQAVNLLADPSHILSEQEQQLRCLQYGLGKANYRQVFIASKLMRKGWNDPYYHRGFVWLTSPASRHQRQTRPMRNCLVRAICITRTGRILLGS